MWHLAIKVQSQNREIAIQLTIYWVVGWGWLSCATLSQGYIHQPTSEAAIFFTPHNSNFTASANETTDNIPCKPKVKSHLLLPKTTEGWKEANDYLENTLVPAVMAAPTHYTLGKNREQRSLMHLDENELKSEQSMGD